MSLNRFFDIPRVETFSSHSPNDDSVVIMKSTEAQFVGKYYFVPNRFPHALLYCPFFYSFLVFFAQIRADYGIPTFLNRLLTVWTDVVSPHHFSNSLFDLKTARPREKACCTWPIVVQSDNCRSKVFRKSGYRCYGNELPYSWVRLRGRIDERLTTWFSSSVDSISRCTIYFDNDCISQSIHLFY